MDAVLDMTPEEVAGKLDTHEQVCAIRYQGILDRMKRLEGIILGAFSSMVIGGAAVIWALFTKLAHM